MSCKQKTFMLENIKFGSNLNFNSFLLKYNEKSFLINIPLNFYTNHALEFLCFLMEQIIIMILLQNLSLITLCDKYCFAVC